MIESSCVICKNGETFAYTTTVTLERDGAVVAFKWVTAALKKQLSPKFD